MKPIRLVLMTAFVAMSGMACGVGSNNGSGGDGTGDLGTVRLDLTTAPVDARCAVITIGAGG